ncbi:MAG TPA: hypothetical protein VIY51_24655 [Xanthobacteraceae bacterium]
MSSTSDIEKRLDALQARLRRAPGVTSDLIAKVIAGAGIRIASPQLAAKAAHIDRLIEAGAWIEAAFALVELELPQWKLRRLTYEEGAWLCSLSKQWSLPEWLSDSVESRHASLPLAVLGVLIEAQRCGEAPSGRAAGSVPRCPADSGSRVNMCCDNFA